MWWYIKAHLETAYAMQSSRVAAFLPDMITKDGRRYFDTIKQRIDQYRALDAPLEESQREVEVITPKKHKFPEEEYRETIIEEQN